MEGFVTKNSCVWFDVLVDVNEFYCFSTLYTHICQFCVLSLFGRRCCMISVSDGEQKFDLIDISRFTGMQAEWRLLQDLCLASFGIVSLVI